MDTVHGILTSMKRLKGNCLQSLHQCFVAWTTPDTTSLLLGTLIDQARSKSELVAENARLAKASHYPAATGETTYLYQNGSDAPGTASKLGSNLEASAVHCPI